MRKLWLISLVLLVLLATAANAAPVHLRCEYLENPLGIDAERPHLSWRSDSTERNWHQSAYQVLVSSSADKLRSGIADVWDSGRQNSSDSVGIPYAGPPLQSQKRYYWKVRIWDLQSIQSESSEPAWWEMGLLRKTDWAGKWIIRKYPDEAADRAGIRWIWAASQDPLHATPKTVVVFHVKMKLRETPKDAALFLIAHGDYKTVVNGREAGHKKNWHAFDREDITQYVRAGENSIDVTVTVPEPDPNDPNSSGKPEPAGLAGLLKITRGNGAIVRLPTGTKWIPHVEGQPRERKVAVISALDSPPFGPTPPLPLPAALLRRSFNVSKEVSSARLYVTALGSYRISVNGKSIGQDVLTPGFTDYSKRVQYQTYDVTLLTTGKNSVAAILGDGWFGSPMTWAGRPFFFQPPPARLLAQLDIRYEDGGHDVIASDESWRTATSPILRSEFMREKSTMPATKSTGGTRQLSTTRGGREPRSLRRRRPPS